MLIVDRLLVGGLAFVLRRVAAAAEAQMNDDSALREELLAAQMRLELGEITDEEFAEIEAAVLAGLRAINERKRGGRAVEALGGDGKLALESVRADLDHRGDGDGDDDRAR